MGSNAKTNGFLKECMADALVGLISKKEYAKITVNEIVKTAGVHRSTWFRNFDSKNEAITYKLVRLWERWAAQHNLTERERYTIDNAPDFFYFNYTIRDLLTLLYERELQSAVYDAFYCIMVSRHSDNPVECYKSRFYSYGLFGLLDDWIKREFYESPEEMADIVRNLL